MFRGRQHGDVLDALIVGLAGLVIDRRISIMLGGFHRSSLEAIQIGGKRKRAKKNRRCFGGWFGVSVRFLRLNLSTAGEA
jgi:hypothetical protein